MFTTMTGIWVPGAKRRSGGGPELATGRVLQFDAARGYGFVAADDGGEDVFLHASVFDGDPDVLVPGMKVRFQTMAGDRGRKAFAVHLVDEPGPEDQPARPVPAPAHVISAPPASSAVPQAPVRPTPTQPAQPPTAPDDEQLCDVLSPPEFRQELTELLLNTVPALTGQQLLHTRQGILELAKKHGWVDG
jgi:cold shock protein